MTFATQTFGDETYGGSELNISSINPSKVSRIGGTKVILTGTFSMQLSYTVTVDSIPVYSGVAGQGNTIYTLDGNTISFVVPPLLLTQIGSVVVRVVAFGGDAVQTTLFILERNFGSVAFEMRRMFPRWTETGARQLEMESQES